VKSNQASAVATARAREAYGEARDNWKKTSPNLESNLTTYQNLDDLKKQIRDVRAARQKTDGAKVAYYQASQRQLQELSGSMADIQTVGMDSGKTLELLETEYQSVRARRDQIQRKSMMPRGKKTLCSARR